MEDIGPIGIILTIKVVRIVDQLPANFHPNPLDLSDDCKDELVVLIKGVLQP